MGVNLSNMVRGFNLRKYIHYRKMYYKCNSRIMKMYYKYRVIRIEGKTSYIGLFDNKENKDIFGDRINFPHGLIGIVISADAKIGEDVTIMQNVTIGMGKAPVIGDNVFIGANACIIGGIKIGNNVRIGAGAVVVKDVPDNTTVVGQPCRYIEKNENYNYFTNDEKTRF